jgi:hypothetical protein
MTEPTTRTTMRGLLHLGQSVWLDDLRRGMLRSGELQALIDEKFSSDRTIAEYAADSCHVEPCPVS